MSLTKKLNRMNKRLQRSKNKELFKKRTLKAHKSNNTKSILSKTEVSIMVCGLNGVQNIYSQVPGPDVCFLMNSIITTINRPMHNKHSVDIFNSICALTDPRGHTQDRGAQHDGVRLSLTCAYRSTQTWTPSSLC